MLSAGIDVNRTNKPIAIKRGTNTARDRSTEFRKRESLFIFSRLHLLIRLYGCGGT